jgi:Uma2 family endonuclease
MIASPDHRPMSPQEYLAWEEEQPLKYEYIYGEAYAMTGGTLPHNSIAVNITTALRTHLRGKGCKVFMADAKVSVSEKGPYFYPDVVVSCEERDRRALKMVQ